MNFKVGSQVLYVNSLKAHIEGAYIDTNTHHTVRVTGTLFISPKSTFLRHYYSYCGRLLDKKSESNC